MPLQSVEVELSCKGGKLSLKLPFQPMLQLMLISTSPESITNGIREHVGHCVFTEPRLETKQVYELYIFVKVLLKSRCKITVTVLDTPEARAEGSFYETATGFVGMNQTYEFRNSAGLEDARDILHSLYLEMCGVKHTITD